MTPTRRAFVALASLVLATMSALPPVLAQAGTPEVGWWTSNQIAGVPIGRALLVPPGGSQVAAGADGAVSVTAVRFPSGPAGATYRAGIELGSDTDGVEVIACPVVGSWEPVSAAPLPGAPAWDCSLGQETGAIDVDAGTIAWDLPAAFVRDGTVDAMLLPTEGGSSFTLTMAAPDETSVSPSTEPSPSTPPASDATPAPPTASGDSGGPAPAAVLGTRPSRAPVAPPGFAGSAPTPTAPVGLPSPLPTTPEGADRDTQVAAVTPEDVSSSTSGRALGGSVLAALLAAAALVSRRTPGGERTDGRGVGRFVRPRDRPPLSI